MKKPILSLLVACACTIARGQQFTLIKDINPGSGSSNICYLTRVNNTLFFAANNGTHGMELWKSDGTTAGTMMVKDINAGAGSSSIGYLTAVGSNVFFVASNGINGTELWKSDGTEAGTVMVKDIRSGSLGSNPSDLVAINNTLYFAASNGTNGTELWKSDGTTAGTVMVKDIATSGSSYPQALAVLNGMLYFAADNGTAGMELWKSNGTAAGTVMVKDIWAGSDGSYPFDLVTVGSTLYFSANNGSSGTELWKSDGTSVGTVMVKDIWTGSGESYPYSLRNIGGTLFFSADNGSNGTELWKSDGTAAGTTLVKDVWPGMESGAAGNFSSLVNKLIFTGNDGVNGYKTWQSDGSNDGTRMATSLISVADGTMQELVETDMKIYASIQETSMGRELYGFSYSSILPLRFLSFSGRLAGNNALLNWSTAQEEQAEDFVIERSINGRDFVPVGRKLAANTAGTHNYEFIDSGATRLNSNVIFYRIKQNDFFGKYTYSSIVMLTVKAEAQLKLFPNPVKNAVTLTGQFSHNEQVEYMLYDNAGRLLQRRQVSVTAGNNSIALDAAALAPGVYYVQLNRRQGQEKLRFLKE